MQFMTVQTVVQAISFELEHISKMRVEAAGTKRTLEQSVADMALNLPNEDVAKLGKWWFRMLPISAQLRRGLPI